MTPSTTPAAALEELLGWRLAVAGRLFRSRADAHMAARVAVGGQATGLLIRLLESDGVTQAELARLQRVEAPSMCRMVDRLEREGLVSRGASPDDRRAVRVTLTPAGRAAAREGARAAVALDDEVFAALDPEERRVLAGLLGRVLDGLGPGPAG
ncbi:MAG: MarR family winged helix-turn-helix transcriptional regulator [Thermoleophilia bacterium]